MLMHRRGRIAEQRCIERGIDQDGTRDTDHEQRQQGIVPRRVLPSLRQSQAREHQHGGDTGADGGLCKGHVDGVEIHEKDSRQQTVDAEQDDDTKEVAHADRNNGDHDQKAKQGDVDQEFDEPSPLVSVSSATSGF